MSAGLASGQPFRHKGQAGGFEQRMAKGPDATRGFKGAGRGSGTLGGPSQNVVGGKPQNGLSASHVSPQISFAQMAMSSKTTADQQFADMTHVGMMPPVISLTSAAIDPKAAARAAAAAAAGAKQKQLEVAAVVSNSATASARAQAAEEAKRQQKRLEVAAEAEAAQQKKIRAQQAAIEEELNRKQRLKEAAQEDAKSRQMQLERAARAQEAGSLPVPAALGQPPACGSFLQQIADGQGNSIQAPGMSQSQAAYGHQQVPLSAVSTQQTTAKPAARPIDGHAWPAIKPSPGVHATVPPQNVWGAVPSSILQAPAPVEEKKSVAQQQKVVKTDNIPQQKNAWGKVTLGRAAEVKQGAIKTSAPSSPSLPQKSDAHESENHAKPSQESLADMSWEGGDVKSEWATAGGSCEGGADTEGVERARKMLDDFLRMRGIQEGGQDNDPWDSENVYRITEDSNDTDEVFFMRPNGVSMLPAPQDDSGGQQSPLNWAVGGDAQQRGGMQFSDEKPAPVKPSAWALGAPRIASRVGDETCGDPLGQGFGQVDCPEGLMAFELAYDDSDPCSTAADSALPPSSAWGNPNPEVDTRSDGEEQCEKVEAEENKSPSVTLKMMLGIGIGGASLPEAPTAAPPAAKKLPVWGKPDGKVDISMDPAIAQIAKDMPPPLMGTSPAQALQQQGSASNQSSDTEPQQFDRTWESSKPPEVLNAGSEKPQHKQDFLMSGQPANPASHNINQQVDQPPSSSSMLQSMCQLQGPASFLKVVPASEQVEETGAVNNMMAQLPHLPHPHQMQQLQAEDVLRRMQSAGDMNMAQNLGVPDHLQRMPNDGPQDSMFPFGLGVGMRGPGGMGGPGGSMSGIGGPGGLPNLSHMHHGQGMQNPFGMGMGSLGMMSSTGPRLGESPNLPPWMQQGPNMNMGSMGMIPNSGPRPGDNLGLPPWLQQQQRPGLPMGPPAGMGNPLPPGMGMGPMGGMGPGGGLELLHMLGGGPGGGTDAHAGNPFQQGHISSNVSCDRDMVGHGAAQPPGQLGAHMGAFGGQRGFGGQPGVQLPGQAGVSPSGHGDNSSNNGGGGFDFNKVFGGMGSTGQGGMSQMPVLGGTMPGTVLSLAEIEGRMGT